MRIPNSIFRALQLLVFVGVVAILIFTVWFYLQLDSGDKVRDVGVEATMLRLRTSAFVYHSRLGFFDGVCTDIGVPKDYTCRETEKTFIIYTRLSDGSWYCTDSTNFLDKMMILNPSLNRCGK